jgi:chromosome partitioning protein
MIVVCGGIKGGSGKTTIATNLTVMRSEGERKVLLVDADDQRSASDWSNQREYWGTQTSWTTIQVFGKKAHLQISKISKYYDDIIVDMGGRDTDTQRSILNIADVFLIPFKPKSFDIWTIGNVINLISEVVSLNKEMKTLAFVNQGDPQGGDNALAIELLSEIPEIECLHNIITHRKAFSNAAANGLGVTELKPSDKKAVQEIQALHDLIYN